jgi:hypothetical protein
MGVYTDIANRLNSLSINLDDYIHINPKTQKTTLQVEKTTLDGISFVAGHKQNDGQFILGDSVLKGAFSRAKAGNGLRAFAGQISPEDLANTPLQLSFLATKGLGFREIFYLPEGVIPARDFNHKILLNQDNRLFDWKFGKMIDSPNVTSIHVDMAQGSLTSIHLDKQGFIFADRDGKIHLGSNVAQHVIDELILKDKFFGLFGDGAIPTALKNNVTFFTHLDKNSLSDPTLGGSSMQNNQFLRNSSVRAILGVGASYSMNGIQLFTRGSLGIDISNDKQLNILRKDYSIVGGVRVKF